MNPSSFKKTQHPITNSRSPIPKCLSELAPSRCQSIDISQIFDQETAGNVRLFPDFAV
jgi:hypothetical protein